MIWYVSDIESMEEDPPAPPSRAPEAHHVVVEASCWSIAFFWGGRR